MNRFRFGTCWPLTLVALAACGPSAREQWRDQQLAQHNLACARAIGTLKTQMERAAMKLRCLEHEQTMLTEWGQQDNDRANAAIIAGSVGAAAGSMAVRSSAPARVYSRPVVRGR